MFLRKWLQHSKNEKLMTAIIHQDKNAFKKLLDQKAYVKADINYQDEYGKTMLHYAIRHVDCYQPETIFISELLKNGANPTLEDTIGTTPFIEIIKMDTIVNRLLILKVFFENLSPIKRIEVMHYRNREEKTGLDYYTEKRSYLEFLKILLDNGADSNLILIHALKHMWETRKSNSDFIEMLLQKGADPNQPGIIPQHENILTSVISLAFLTNQDLTIVNLFLSYGGSLKSFSYFYSLVGSIYFDLMPQKYAPPLNQLIPLLISYHALLTEIGKLPETFKEKVKIGKTFNIPSIMVSAKRQVQGLSGTIEKYRQHIDEVINGSSNIPIPSDISGLVCDYIGLSFFCPRRGDRPSPVPSPQIGIKKGDQPIETTSFNF